MICQSTMKSWGKGGFFESWVEPAFFGLLVVGFVLGKLLLDTVVLYFIIVLAGLIAGRLAYIKRENDPAPFYAISLSFLFGFLLGHRVGNGFMMILLFAAAAALSYYLHKNLEFLA